MQYVSLVRVAAILAAVGAASACSSGEPTVVVSGPGFGVSPIPVALAPGATQAVTLTLREDLRAQGVRFAWRVADTAVARLDSVSAATTRAYVRAVAPGSTVLELVGGGYTSTIPVLVQ